MLAVFFVIAAFASSLGLSPETPAARSLDLSKHFGDFSGCFVLLNTSTGEISRYNPDQCGRRLSPCSTFKIPSALIGLETGVLRDADHEMKWDGTKHQREALNRDHTLRSAMPNSVVWYFQNVARQVGPERMQHWLDTLNYGNRDSTGGIDQFWLVSSLLISADEQVEFLRQLQSGELPTSERSEAIVKEILELPWDGPGVLRGKTGTGGSPAPGKATLGWFVGWVTINDTAHVFACNIEGGDEPTGLKAKAIALDALKEHFAPLAGQTPRAAGSPAP